jgi:MFS family permease
MRGDMVPRADLAGAVTLNAMGFNLARSLGPAVGGLIVAAAGAAAAFAVNAASYLGLIVVLFRWKPERPQETLARETIGAAMSSGVRYVAMSPRINTVLLRAALFGLGASAVQALMPLVARQTMAGGPETFGLLLGAFGVGAVGGAFLSARVRRALVTETLVRIACVIFGLCAAVTALSPWLLLTIPALMVAGAAWVLTLSTFNVTVQMSSPRWVVARALALYQMAAFGGMALGSWVWGQTAEASGLAAALLASGVVQGGCALVGLRFPLAPATELNLDPLGVWREPSTVLSIEPRSGPVVVAIDYKIDEADVPAFLAAMAERRRIRRRDGARNWSLLRDLAEPTHWVERYHTETWLDYVRHNLRRTHDDVGISQRITALHRGDQPPAVRRMIERPARPPEEGDVTVGDTLTDPNRIS